MLQCVAGRALAAVEQGHVQGPCHCQICHADHLAAAGRHNNAAVTRSTPWSTAISNTHTANVDQQGGTIPLYEVTECQKIGLGFWRIEV